MTNYIALYYPIACNKITILQNLFNQQEKFTKFFSIQKYIFYKHTNDNRLKRKKIHNTTYLNRKSEKMSLTIIYDNKIQPNLQAIHFFFHFTIQYINIKNIWNLKMRFMLDQDLFKRNISKKNA